MSIEFRCGGCGRMLRAQEGQEGKQARCPACGDLTVIPATVAEAVPVLAEPEVVEDAVQTAEDVEQPPRRSRGPAERTCPGCDAPMEAGAVICLECGFDRRLGRRRKTKVKRFDRHWTPPPTLVARIIGLVLTLWLCGTICLAMVCGGVHPIIPALILVVVGSLGTMLAGWYHTLDLTRDRQGALLLTRRTYFCFAPAGKVTVDLAECSAVQIDAGDSGGGSATDSPGWSGILGTVALIFFFGWIGVYIARNNISGHGSANVRFSIRLLGHKKRKNLLTLYTGSNEEFMRDLVDTLKDQADLEILR
jgi:hypothetical protein